MPLRLLPPLLLAAFSAGCVGMNTATSVSTADRLLVSRGDSCGIAALGPMTGQPFTDLADYQLAGPLRVIWPRQEITLERQPQRLNAEIDDSGTILRLVCG